MKLELKHLAPYLPYKLRLKEKNWSYIYLMVGVTFSHIYATEIGDNEIFDIDVLEQNVKPILRPLSDLHKNKFNFIYDKETDYYSINDWLLLDTESRLTSKFSYNFWSELFKNHFDVFGLIDQELAVDINTLSE